MAHLASYNPPRLYSDLASWWPLLSAPQEYAEEADFARQTLCEASPAPPRTLLELGCGGGNNASHLKKHFQMTLLDFSTDMLEMSRRLNPECEHIQGDMRTVRLDRAFDAVFIHDAIMYMTTADDLRRAMTTAFAHCRPGGTALIMPDFVRETFVSGVHHGGHDDTARALRYIEWTFDPDPADTTYTVDFVYLLREGNGPVRVEHDAHVFGLFSRSEWMVLLDQAGFESRIIQDPFGREVFAARRKVL
jgi:SAM-dependent methyltransferase